jgi:hypothetical protein
MPMPQLEGEAIIHDETHNNYDKLPKWLQEKLDNQAVEQQPQNVGGGGRLSQPAAFYTDLDDVPFASCDPLLEDWHIYRPVM